MIIGGAFIATEQYLDNEGGRRIAHLKGPNGLAVSENRFKGYKDCLSKHKIPLDENLIITTNFKAESAIVPIHRLMSLENPPDSVFAVNDVVASVGRRSYEIWDFLYPSK